MSAEPHPALSTFVARQPIFDREMQVHAYELLFRANLEQNLFAEGMDGTIASSSVLSDSFLYVGLRNMTDSRRAFINFTRDLLLMDFASLFPSEMVVVELLETVYPDAQVLATVRRLKEEGYTIALDDFANDPAMDPLVDLADIIKVDFTLSSSHEREELAQRALPRGIELLAEKVETHAEHQQALDLGYSYFQGYFFSRPIIVSNERIPESKLSALRLLQEANQANPNIDRIEALVKQDLSLSYKLLRYINSAFFGLKQEIHSVRQALVLLGLRNVRRWASLIALTCLGEEPPAELLLGSLIRARFHETLAPLAGLRERDQDLFFLGMFSLLDALLNQPMESLIEDIPLSDDIKGALLGEGGRLRDLHEAALAYEEANWSSFDHLGRKMGLITETVPHLYADSIVWAQEILQVGALTGK